MLTVYCKVSPGSAWVSPSTSVNNESVLVAETDGASTLVKLRGAAAWRKPANSSKSNDFFVRTRERDSCPDVRLGAANRLRLALKANDLEITTPAKPSITTAVMSSSRWLEAVLNIETKCLRRNR